MPKKPSTAEEKRKAVAEMLEVFDRWFEITHDIIMFRPTEFRGLETRYDKN